MASGRQWAGLEPRWRQGRPGSQARGPRCAVSPPSVLSTASPIPSTKSEGGSVTMETNEGTSQLGGNPTQDGVSCEKPQPQSSGARGDLALVGGWPQRPRCLHRTAAHGPGCPGAPGAGQSRAGEEPCMPGEAFPPGSAAAWRGTHGASAPRSPPLWEASFPHQLLPQLLRARQHPEEAPTPPHP